MAIPTPTPPTAAIFLMIKASNSTKQPPRLTILAA